MARGSNKLTALAVAKQKTPGRYADGGGLYLQISPTGSKSWLFRYTRQGKAREMGLGALAVVSLLQAREKAGPLQANGKSTGWATCPPLTARGG